MPHHEIETHWMGKMQFNSILNNLTVVMDAPHRAGGEDSGTIPKPLVLAALSGCSGMDVVGLLRKQDILPDHFSLKVTGELTRQHPIEYMAVHITYEFKANPIHRQAVLQAVDDSQEKYCGVSHMLKKAIPVKWSIVFNDELIFTNQQAETSLTQ